MAISKMKRLSAFCLREDTDRLIKKLMRLRCVSLERAAEESASASGLALPPPDGRRAELENEIAETTQALELLHPYSKEKKSLFSPLISADLAEFERSGRAEKAKETVRAAGEIRRRLAEIGTERVRAEGNLALCRAWRAYDMPLSFTSTRLTEVLTGSFPAGTLLSRVSEELSEHSAMLEEIGSDHTAEYVAVLCHQDANDEVARILSAHGFLRAAFREMKDTPAEEGERAQRRLDSLAAEEEGLKERLSLLADGIADAEILSDLQKTSLAALDAAGGLAGTEHTDLLSGWVPEKNAAKAAAVLELYGCAYELTDPAEGDEPPVLLENKSFFSNFEWVMGMYSYPLYGSYDPTAVMGIFYIIIFGLMFADAGYGFVLSLVCLLAVKLLPLKATMKRFLSMFGWCGLSCMVWGVLLGSYFGDFPLQLMNNMLGVRAPESLALLLDPLQNPMGFLILSLGVGAVHLIAGMAVRGYMMIRRGHTLDAILDIGSPWLLFAGIGLFAAGVPGGIWVLVAGVCAMVFTQGRHEKNIFMKFIKGLGSLYGLINYASDLLSYSRIMALGLASAVVGQVVNILATIGGPSVVGFLVMILVFLFGHLLNLAINLLGTFVHTSRLQYIEFFGKFFEDGGEPFTPLSVSNEYSEEPADAASDR